MAKKPKLSGKKWREKARTMAILSGGKWRGKRGRPKGETESVEARRGMIELDFLWLVAGGVLDTGWTDLKIANELLLDDPTRWEKYKLGRCQYRGVHKKTLRRRITDARNKF